MLYNEFVILTKTKVSDEEYHYIEESYYDSKLDKAEFCKRFDRETYMSLRRRREPNDRR